MTETNKNRRQALKLRLISMGALIGAKATGNGLSCQQTTPPQTKGPFYPVVDQADKDTDLTTVAGSPTVAAGKIILVTGQVTDLNCRPVPNALVEIWQACSTGKYNHPADTNSAALDPHFQYWGKGVSASNGSYLFKTIIPGAYPADVGWIRPPHIHFKIQCLGYPELITQLYFAGDPLNDKDFILQKLKPAEQSKVVIPLVAGTRGFPEARFDITLTSVK